MNDKKQQEAEQPGRSHKIWLWIKRWWLPIAILLITSTGLACALSIPQQVFETPREPANDKSAPVLLAQSNLRLAFLYITGGAIAVMGLVETFRKNNNEKLKNDQDKEKNDREHERWVKAERRERYAKAVEQLGDEKAPVRMGGVYTLVGLVDDWLEEKSLSDDERLKEGQAIINNLCAYIRSPFPLASYYDELSQASPTSEGIYKDKEEEFYADKAVLKSEADVRFGIIKEMHDHIQASRENDWGPWSNFEYNFSGSVFFYPVELTKSYYKKPVNFSGSHYYKKVDFSGSTYEKDATFSTSNFRSTYKDVAYFYGSIYQGEADFSRSTYQSWADFRDSIYQSWADFSRSTYQDGALFSRSIYQGGALFSRSTYQDGADFSCSTYQGGAHFSGSIFYQKVYFGADGDNSSFSRFTDCAPQFYDETNHKNTLFGSHNNDFTVDIDKGYPIDLDSKGIPLNCKFLTSGQKKYLEDKIQEIEKTKNKLLEVKDPKEKAELSKKLRPLYKELHEWRKEAITVKVEDVAAEDTES